MEILSWNLTITWFVIACSFLIIEAMTTGLTSIWFAAGALFALMLSIIGASLWIQIAGFIIVSILLLIFTREIFVKKLKTGQEKTNIDALVGKVAIVETDIDSLEQGRVQINGQSWAVKSYDDSAIKSGTKVSIVAIEGVKLIVKEL